MPDQDAVAGPSPDGRHGVGDVRFFDRVARLYDAVMPSARPGEFDRAFAAADRPVERVVDLAGGTGRVAAALRDQPVDGADDPSGTREVVVADVSAGMLARARDRGLDGLRSDAGRLPLATDAVDAVVVVDALHHLPDQRAALSEAARVVAPGGVVVVRDFDPSTVTGRGIALGERLLGMGSRFVSADEAAAALSEADLRSRVLDRGLVYTVAGVAVDGS